jgi:hypothetical protein
MKPAGVRFKVFPKSRKKALKIRRRKLKEFRLKIQREVEMMEGSELTIQRITDQVTGVPLIKKEWFNRKTGMMKMTLEVDYSRPLLLTFDQPK